MFRVDNFTGELSRLWRALGLLLAVSAAVAPAVAEELLLKSGQKIVGTIVGYEDDMFRVHTEYGFALIRKDSVQTVNFSSGAKNEPAKKTKSTPAAPEKPSRPAAAANSDAAPATAPAVKAPPAQASAPESAKPEIPVIVAAPTPAPVPVAVKPASPPPPPPPSRPVDEPLPAKLQEHVDGTTYVNDSFHFAMFKPPGWKVYEEVPKDTGSAIMAIGTDDEQTLLFVDRQVWSGAPDFKTDGAETKLRSTYQEYQKLLESPAQLDGQPAIRRVFKGVIDGMEWHGLSVHTARGNAVFGIIGLTSAETYQFQQALFNKIINSFHFLAAASPSASAAPPVAKP